MLLPNGVFSCFFYFLEAETSASADGFADDANATVVPHILFAHSFREGSSLLIA